MIPKATPMKSFKEQVRKILRSNCTLTNINNHAALIMDKGKADCLNDLIVAFSQLNALYEEEIKEARAHQEMETFCAMKQTFLKEIERKLPKEKKIGDCLHGPMNMVQISLDKGYNVYRTETLKILRETLGGGK